MQTIELSFNPTITTLAGNKYGRTIYNEQVRSKIISTDMQVEIVIPDSINEIATSFLQGFFKDLVDKMGIDGVDKNITFKTNIPNLKDVTTTALLTMR